MSRVSGSRGGLAALALVLGLAVAGPATPQVSEYGLKAVLLFKLPQFVYWPEPAPRGRLGMCLYGENPFDASLDRLARQPIDNRPVQVMHLGSLAEAAECDFIFVSRSEARNLDAVLRRLESSRVVTVSDLPGFARAGGMVELTLQEGRVGLLVNRKAARRQGLEFSAQLLRLAKVVES